MEPLTPVKVIRNYEGVVILHPGTTEQDQKEVFRRNKEIVERFSGQLHHLDTWGRRKLANPIKKNEYAIYFHATFTASAAAVAELERTLGIDERVLRFMHTRLDDRVPLSKYLEKYRESLAESVNREKEREAKFLKKKAAREGGFRDGDDGGGRDFRENRERRPPRGDRE